MTNEKILCYDVFCLKYELAYYLYLTLQPLLMLRQIIFCNIKCSSGGNCIRAIAFTFSFCVSLAKVQNSWMQGKILQNIHVLAWLTISRDKERNSAANNNSDKKTMQVRIPQSFVIPSCLRVCPLE